MGRRVIFHGPDHLRVLLLSFYGSKILEVPVGFRCLQCAVNGSHKDRVSW